MVTYSAKETEQQTTEKGGGWRWQGSGGGGGGLDKIWKKEVANIVRFSQNRGISTLYQLCKKTLNISHPLHDKTHPPPPPLLAPPPFLVKISHSPITAIFEGAGGGSDYGLTVLIFPQEYLQMLLISHKR